MYLLIIDNVIIVAARLAKNHSVQ